MFVPWISGNSPHNQTRIVDFWRKGCGSNNWPHKRVTTSPRDWLERYKWSFFSNNIPIWASIDIHSSKITYLQSFWGVVWYIISIRSGICLVRCGTLANDGTEGDSVTTIMQRIHTILRSYHTYSSMEHTAAHWQYSYNLYSMLYLVFWVIYLRISVPSRKHWRQVHVSTPSP